MAFCSVVRFQFIFPLFCSVLSLEESVKAMSLSAEEDDIPWDSIRDNRDLTVFTSWDPKERSPFICSQFGPSLSFAASVYVSFFYSPRRLADEHRRLSLEEETIWLRIRSLTLRLVTSMALQGHTCTQNAETTNENGIGDKASILSSLLSQLNQTLQTAATLVEKRVQVCRRWGRSEEDVWGRRAQNVFCCSIHSWDPPLRAWPQLCPSGAAIARLQPSSCVSTYRSWSCSGSVRTTTRTLQLIRSWMFRNVMADFFSFPSFADESSELQTQICNGFKSLVVQLQGELPS